MTQDYPLPKCFVIHIRDIDGNLEEIELAKVLNKATDHMDGVRPYFYDVHVQGLDLLVALNFKTTDERLIRDLAVLELQDTE
jgi:hypothetical protein